jgi:hypothetical protein
VLLSHSCRLQEIAGVMENSLSLTPAHDKASPQSGVPQFKLEVFSVLWDCLHKTWSPEVFLTSLTHRFWKLSLQLIIRTSEWLAELHHQSPPPTGSSSERSSTAPAGGASGSGPSTRGEDSVSLTVPQNLHLIHDSQMFTVQVQYVQHNTLNTLFFSTCLTSMYSYIYIENRR